MNGNQDPVDASASQQVAEALAGLIGVAAIWLKRLSNRGVKFFGVAHVKHTPIVTISLSF